MKKIILFIVMLFVTTQVIFAQQAIAKIKYEEAEEAYAANKFELAVSKLNEAEALLKSTNPRILYLKIMALSNYCFDNANKDYSLVLSAKQLCKKYLKNYEDLPDNEDKYRDIYKKSEVLKNYPDDEAELHRKLIYNKKRADVFKFNKDSINYTKAFEYYSYNASLGAEASLFELGRMYYYGLGVEKDLKIAFNYFYKSANKGFAEAQYSLGQMHRLGEGIAVDNNEAVKWYKLSAIQNYQYAQWGLGYMYHEGLGVPKDFNQAFAYFNKAAEQNNASAQNWLGFMYFNGEGIAKDWVQADKYFRLAVAHPDLKKYASGKLYEIYHTGGFGIKKDKAEAKKWEVPQ